MVDFSELYRTYARDVHRFALFLSGDAALADDIVSETFIRLWHARGRVDLTTVKSYLLVIARNLFLAERRHARRMTEVDERARDDRPGPERRAQSHFDLQVVLAALQTLPEIDRAAVLLRGGRNALRGSGRGAEHFGRRGAGQSASRAAEAGRGPGAPMNISRDVVKDLIVVYLAGDASADTRALVESYLKTDPELAREVAAARGPSLELPATPAPTAEKQALDAARQQIQNRTATLAVALLFTVLPLTFAFRGASITFFLIRDAPIIGIAWWATAPIMWVWHLRIRRRLRVSGL